MTENKFELEGIQIFAESGEVRFTVRCTSAFGNTAAGSVHNIDMASTRDRLQAVAETQGVTVDIFDEMFSAIRAFIKDKSGQDVDGPRRRVMPEA